MIGGQVLDLEGEHQKPTPALVDAIHRAKTGALIRVSVVAGGIFAGATPEQVKLLDTFGRKAGLAFQIVDDVLDVTQDSAQLGKTAGKDLASDKATWPAVFGLEQSLADAERLITEAFAALEPFGPNAEGLKAVARFPGRAEELAMALSWPQQLPALSRGDLLTALKDCFDPEVKLNLVDLGLVYDISTEPDPNSTPALPRQRVKVTMTLTTPQCPGQRTDLRAGTQSPRQHPADQQSRSRFSLGTKVDPAPHQRSGPQTARPLAGALRRRRDSNRLLPRQPAAQFNRRFFHQPVHDVRQHQRTKDHQEC